MWCSLASPQCRRLVSHAITSHRHVPAVGRQQQCCRQQFTLWPPTRRNQFVEQLLPKHSTNMATTATSMNPNGQDDIKIRVVQTQERGRVLDFLRLHYYREEPLTCGSEPKQQDKADEDFNMSNIEHGTCLMAVLKESDRIVGAVLAGPKGPDEAEHLFEAAAKEGSTKWGKIMHFLAGVERDAAVCQRFGVQRVLHAHVIGVDKEMRGKNVGARLMTQLKTRGKELNYELLTSDCTSYFSAKLCERLGWECVNVAYYKDYVDGDKGQVFRPPAPHDCCRTYATRL